MSEQTQTVEPSGAPKLEDLPSVIGVLIHVLSDDGFPRGDLAALRRMDADAPQAPAFWRLSGRVAIPTSGEEPLRRWALVVHGMALLAPDLTTPTRLGSALAEAGFSEPRLARLLNARGGQFRSLVPRLCRQLGAKGIPANWYELAPLILAEGRREDIAQVRRREIARHYYATTAKSE